MILLFPGSSRLEHHRCCQGSLQRLESAGTLVVSHGGRTYSGTRYKPKRNKEIKNNISKKTGGANAESTRFRVFFLVYDHPCFYSQHVRFGMWRRVKNDAWPGKVTNHGWSRKEFPCVWGIYGRMKSCSWMTEPNREEHFVLVHELRRENRRVVKLDGTGSIIWNG